MDVAVSREADARVAVITLNRPDSFNSFTRGMLSQLHAELEDVYRDPEVTSVVLTGAGRAFSAGQDLHELIDELDLPYGGNDSRLREGYGPLALLLGDSPKPVVAAVNGVAAGAGLALAGLCTARVASTNAAFVPAFIDLGLIPDTGASHTIPRLVGVERAIRWFADGGKVEAAVALTWGLVDRVVEPDDLLHAAVSVAVRFGGRDPRALVTTRELVEVGSRTDLQSALLAETNEQIVATSREEFKRAVSELAR